MLVLRCYVGFITSYRIKSSSLEDGGTPAHRCPMILVALEERQQQPWTSDCSDLCGPRHPGSVPISIAILQPNKGTQAGILSLSFPCGGLPKVVTCYNMKHQVPMATDNEGAELLAHDLWIVFSYQIETPSNTLFLSEELSISQNITALAHYGEKDHYDKNVLTWL